MRKFTVHKLRIKESLELPSEGIFWVINNRLVAFDDPVDTSGRYFDDVEHVKIWNEIKHMYKVDGKEVDYNYCPRGRVMVNAVKDNDGTFLHFDVYIYIDNCINKEDVVNEIKYTFRLNKPNCDIKYIGADGGITSNHYTCHNCR